MIKAVLFSQMIVIRETHQIVSLLGTRTESLRVSKIK